MAWPPTNIDTLRSVAAGSQSLEIVAEAGRTSVWCADLRGGSGLFVCDPQYLLPLEQDGLIERRDMEAPFIKITGVSRLTDKGREAMQMLNGHRKVSSYAMPDWLLREITH